VSSVELRPAQPEDRPFLFRLYATTRADELAVLPWTDEQKRSFLEQQFLAQDRAYRDNYPDATFSVIIRAGEPIGRLYVAPLGDDELRVIDIALLPEERGKEIGSELMTGVIASAVHEGRMVSLHVERWNRAVRFYERLGFVRTGENEVYVRMERLPR
jgi:ribosomal protein S18 acetylase RimI-like enzyme